MKNFRLDDSYTKEDIENINVLLFITSLIMTAMFAVAQIGGLI